jgi:hypothetical protein
MTNNQIAGRHVGGMGHAVDGAVPGSNPLAAPPQLKRTANVPINPGTRSRSNDSLHGGKPDALGRAICDAAKC